MASRGSPPAPTARRARERCTSGSSSTIGPEAVSARRADGRSPAPRRCRMRSAAPRTTATARPRMPTRVHSENAAASRRSRSDSHSAFSFCMRRARASDGRSRAPENSGRSRIFFSLSGETSTAVPSRARSAHSAASRSSAVGVVPSGVRQGSTPSPSPEGAGAAAISSARAAGQRLMACAGPSRAAAPGPALRGGRACPRRRGRPPPGRAARRRTALRR